MNFYQRSPSVDGLFCWTDTKEGEKCGILVLRGDVRLNIPHYPIIRASSISTSMVVMTFLFSILYVFCIDCLPSLLIIECTGILCILHPVL